MEAITRDTFDKGDLNLKEITTDSELMSEVKKYIKDPKALDRIQKAYEFAKEKHGDQKRANGDPYIVHPLTTAYLLAQLRMGPNTIIGGLLHDVLEDTQTTNEEIIDAFGPEVNMLVESVTKVSYFAKDNRDSIKATYLRKLYLSMAKDIRVMIIKICDRLHNMMTIHNLPEAKQKIIARETLDIYSTIAHRIGMNNAKGALEDLSFEVLEPEQFKRIETLVEKGREQRVHDTNKLMNDIKRMLGEKGIHNIEIYGRPKNFYSIYRKITKFGKTFDEINDLLAIRVVTQSIDDCYKVLGYIHQTYLPLPHRFKDYIATPKNNIYQSLHTTVSTPNGTIFEVQIRTEDMDEVAEVGAAAHWRYKEGVVVDPNKAQKEIDEKLDIFKRILTFEDEKSDEGLEQELQEDIFTSSVYVLTPNGKVITLPWGATVLDFAYRIHSEVGEHTVGAKINGVYSPINTVLNSGDVIEVKTNPNQEPSLNWLKIAISPSAKNRIRKYLSEQAGNDAVSRQDEITKAIEKLRGTMATFINSKDNKLRKRTDIEAEQLVKDDGYKDLKDMYMTIYNGRLTIEDAANRYFLKDNTSKDKEILNIIKNKEDYVPNIKDDLIVNGINNIKIQIANCCNPIPFEPVVGYVTKGHGIKAHLATCPNVIKEETSDRVIPIKWNKDAVKNRNYVTKLHFEGTDRPNFLYDLTRVLTSLKADVINVNISSDQKHLTASGVFKIKVHDNEQLSSIISSLKAIAGVHEVSRQLQTEDLKGDND